MFSQVCVITSVHRGEVDFPACITGHMTRRSASRGVCIQGGLNLGGLHSGGWADPTPQDTKGYVQQASGMHPTGMHSCLA